MFLPSCTDYTLHNSLRCTVTNTMLLYHKDFYLYVTFIAKGDGYKVGLKLEAPAYIVAI